MTSQQFEILIKLCKSQNPDDKRLALNIIAENYKIFNPLWVRHLLHTLSLVFFDDDALEFTEIPNVHELIQYWYDQKQISTVRDIRDWTPDKNYFITSKEEIKNEAN